MPNELEKGIIRYVDSSILTAPYTQIYTCVVKAVTEDGYTVDFNNTEYTGVPAIGTATVNQTVKIVVPNNQYSNMFILAESEGVGGTGAVSSVNGLTGDVYLTASSLALGNVPNVTTNNQTPTYTPASTLSELASGELLSIAFGKISKAITTLISHIGDLVIHITSTERTNWNSAYSDSHTHTNKSILDLITASFTTADKSNLDSNTTNNHTHSNKSILDDTTASFTTTDKSNLDSNTTARHTHLNKTILDNTTASYTTAEQTKLSGLSNYTLPVANTSLGGVKSGTDITVDGSGNVSVVDNSHNHITSNVTGLDTALSNKLETSAYTASDVLTKIKTVDGTGSGLDADLLDGQEGTYYLNRVNHTGVNALTSYTPTASNLGTITTHTAFVRSGSGVARYKLVANTGTWTAGTNYTLCTLTAEYRPSVAITKRIMVNQVTTTYRFIQLTINTDGTVVANAPVALSAVAIIIDETYLL